MDIYQRLRVLLAYLLSHQGDVMPDDKTPTPKADAPKTDAPKTAAPKANESTSTGKAETATATPEEHPDARALQELADLGVDPRLDNRTGDQRPELVEWPAKPQQIDGPEVTDDFAEHAETVREEAEKFAANKDFTPAGAKSEGPHGLGPEGITVGDDHGKPLTK